MAEVFKPQPDDGQQSGDHFTWMVEHRKAWVELLNDAAERRIRVVLVFSLDRAFHSAEYMRDTIAAWQTSGVTLESARGTGAGIDGCW